jgi:hypothetical protein
MHGSDGSGGGQMVGGGSVGVTSGVSASIQLMNSIYDDLIHELVLDLCFAVHKHEKTASFQSADTTLTLDKLPQLPFSRPVVSRSHILLRLSAECELDMTVLRLTCSDSH